MERDGVREIKWGDKRRSREEDANRKKKKTGREKVRGKGDRREALGKKKEKNENRIGDRSIKKEK